MKRQVLNLGAFLFSFAVGVAVAVAAMSISYTPTQDEKIIASIHEAVRPESSHQEEVSEERTWEDNYSNETEIGRRGNNKIEIRGVSRNDRGAATVEFFSRGNKRVWTEHQSLSFENLNYGGCNPQITDFNNDGFKDITFVSGQAARGANEIRTLLIYNP